VPRGRRGHQPLGIGAIADVHLDHDATIGVRLRADACHETRERHIDGNPRAQRRAASLDLRRRKSWVVDRNVHADLARSTAPQCNRGLPGVARNVESLAHTRVGGDVLTDLVECAVLGPAILHDRLTVRHARGHRVQGDPLGVGRRRVLLFLFHQRADACREPAPAVSKVAVHHRRGTAERRCRLCHAQLEGYRCVTNRVVEPDAQVAVYFVLCVGIPRHRQGHAKYRETSRQDHGTAGSSARARRRSRSQPHAAARLTFGRIIEPSA
jgi:hypothetical protein